MKMLVVKLQTSRGRSDQMFSTIVSSSLVTKNGCNYREKCLGKGRLLFFSTPVFLILPFQPQRDLAAIQRRE